VLGLTLLSYVTSNLGIAMRQKTMIMVAALMLFSLYYASRRQTARSRQPQARPVHASE
jgi:hypothetical protein